MRKVSGFTGAVGRLLILLASVAVTAAHAGMSSTLNVPIQVNVDKTAATTSTPTVSGAFVYAITCTPSPGGHVFATPAATINLNQAVPATGSAIPASVNIAASSTDCVVTQTSRPAAPTGYMWVGSPPNTSTGPAVTIAAPVTTPLQTFSNTLAQAITITGVASPAAGGTVSCSPNPVEIGGSSQCNAAASMGYSFVNWDTSAANACPGGADGNFYVDAPDQDCTVTAIFQLDNVPITTAVNPLAGGTLSCTPNPVPNGESSSCTATANANYHLVDISGCGGMTSSASPYATGSVNAPCTVTANFAPDNHVVTGLANPVAGGAVNCVSPVAHGSTTTCTVTTNAGYTFTGYSGCGGTPAATSPYVTGVVTANCTVTGSFSLNTIPVASVAVSAAGGSVVCSPNPVPFGATTTCTARANPGYVFSNMSGCGGVSTTATTYTTAAITAACTVTGIFAAQAAATPVPGPAGVLLVVLAALLVVGTRLRLRR